MRFKQQRAGSGRALRSQSEFRAGCDAWQFARNRTQQPSPHKLMPDEGDNLKEGRHEPMSAGGVADEWVTQMLRQSDAQVMKKYSQVKLRMKREAPEKLNRQANEMDPTEVDALMSARFSTEAFQ